MTSHFHTLRVIVITLPELNPILPATVTKLTKNIPGSQQKFSGIADSGKN
jgi:hypothetical protein